MGANADLKDPSPARLRLANRRRYTVFNKLTNSPPSPTVTVLSCAASPTLTAASLDFPVLGSRLALITTALDWSVPVLIRFGVGVFTCTNLYIHIKSFLLLLLHLSTWPQKAFIVLAFGGILKRSGVSYGGHVD